MPGSTAEKRSGSKKGVRELPAFKTSEEFIEFIDTHDLGSYLDSLEEVSPEFELDPKLKRRVQKRAQERLKKRLLTLRLENRQVEEARRIATRKGMGYLTLMRVWIQEGIQREKKAS